MKTLVCLGLGYSAEVFARRKAAEGWHIIGSSTSSTGAQRIERLGYEAVHFDGSRREPAVTAAIARASHVLVSAPPADMGDPVLLQHSADLAAAGNLEWIGYLSTIGVYGDHQGRWVDETTAPTPVSARSKRRLAADLAWLALGRATGKRVEVFRLAGIYGPGRSTLDALREGTARRILKPGQVFNRIHVEDIANVLEAAIAAPAIEAEGIYNVTDDEPAPPEDVITFAAGLLGLPTPPAIAYDAAALSPMARSFYEENKRVRNARIRDALGARLAYPTYREGLTALAGAARQHDRH